jgi:hypothetical protein
MSLRRGSATALNASEVVAALAMFSTYTHMGICQALYLPLFFLGSHRSWFRSFEGRPPWRTTPAFRLRRGDIVNFALEARWYDRDGD